MLPDVAAVLAFLALECVLDTGRSGYESEQLLHGSPCVKFGRTVHVAVARCLPC